MAGKNKVKCFQISDDDLEPDEIEEKINTELKGLGAVAEDVLSIMQCSGCAITRVFYKTNE